MQKIEHNGIIKTVYANEAGLSSAIIKKLNGFERTKLRKVKADVCGSPVLDIEGAIRGFHVWIESKQPGKKPTDRQFMTMKSYIDEGSLATWTDHVAGAVAFYEWICSWETRCFKLGVVKITPSEKELLMRGFV